MLTAFVCRNVLVRILRPFGRTVRSNELVTICRVSLVVNWEVQTFRIWFARKKLKSSLGAAESGVKLPFWELIGDAGENDGTRVGILTRRACVCPRAPARTPRAS